MLKCVCPIQPKASGASLSMSRLWLATFAAAGVFLVAFPGALMAQEGPERESGDTVAKPKKKDAATPADDAQ